MTTALIFDADEIQRARELFDETRGVFALEVLIREARRRRVSLAALRAVVQAREA